MLYVDEDVRTILGQGRLRSVRYATLFPSPRTERVSPGHLVATATVGSGPETVIWRWYDAVLLGEDTAGVRLWEPAHGEVVAQPRAPEDRRQPGTRAYLSAGLPGADWWVAGPAAATAEDADIELDEVQNWYDQHELWGSVS